MARFKYDAEARRPQDLASGGVLAPGDTVELSADEQKKPHNKRLIDEGVLRAQKETPKPQPVKEADSE